jgi:hypothetical protein
LLRGFKLGASKQFLMKGIEQQESMVNPNVPLANRETLGDLYVHSMARTALTLASFASPAE